MTVDEAYAFRIYLWNATTTQLAQGNNCITSDGGDCYGTGGVCLPRYNSELGVYSFTCDNPLEDLSFNYEFDVFVFGLEVRYETRV